MTVGITFWDFQNQQKVVLFKQGRKLMLLTVNKKEFRKTKRQSVMQQWSQGQPGARVCLTLSLLNILKQLGRSIEACNGNSWSNRWSPKISRVPSSLSPINSFINLFLSSSSQHCKSRPMWFAALDLTTNSQTKECPHVRSNISLSLQNCLLEMLSYAVETIVEVVYASLM